MGQQSGEWARPTSSSGGSSSTSRQADSTDASGYGRASGRATDVRPSSSSTHHQHHHSRTSVDHRSLFSSSQSSVDRRSLSKSHHHHGRREGVDKEKYGSDVRSSCYQSHHKQRRRESSQWFHRLPDQQRWTTQQVWWADSAEVTGPTDSAAVHNSAGDESAGNHGSAVDDEPEIVYDSAGVADPTQEQDLAGANSAQHQDSALDDSARGDEPVAQGTPAGTMPAAVRDTSRVSDVSSMLFLFLPRTINQPNLLEFMTRMNLLQWGMDLGLPVPYIQSRPVGQTPTTRDYQTPPRWSKTPVERSRTPVRRSRTPVRFKVNPAKYRRASRASLLDLGESEVTDRVLWSDQPSLVDTMNSTVRIAQGLKEDEEVEKTTLPETLNTSSPTFKHLTVKHVFPREPY